MKSQWSMVDHALTKEARPRLIISKIANTSLPSLSLNDLTAYN